ncbi:flagellin N-terminal helical domain-containing protein [Endothiovibrio diazotrophicus]
MSLAINTNVSSLNGQHNLNKTQQGLQGVLQQLSSGLRINSAKDDAAGLAISTLFSAQIGGLNQAFRNANDGISMAQVGEGALGGVTEKLQRMRDLAVQSSNGTYSASDRASMQKEVAALQAEIGRVIDATEFNGQKVLATSGSVDIQVGAGGTSGVDTIQVNTANLAGTTGNGIGSALGGNLNISTQGGAQSAISMIDRMLDRVSSMRADYGAVQNRFESSMSNLSNVAMNLSASNSRITDADYAQTTAEQTRLMILQRAGVAMMGQANAVPQFALNLLGDRVG